MDTVTRCKREGCNYRADRPDGYCTARCARLIGQWCYRQDAIVPVVDTCCEYSHSREETHERADVYSPWYLRRSRDGRKVGDEYESRAFDGHLNIYRVRHISDDGFTRSTYAGHSDRCNCWQSDWDA